MKKVAIIGMGYVGNAYLKIFPDALTYDTTTIHNSTQKEINDECELAIICVPTPTQEDGSTDLSNILDVLDWLSTPLVLIKSAVPPGTTDMLNSKFNRYIKDAGWVYMDTDIPIQICVSPEYVGESKYHTTPWLFMSPTDPRYHDYVIIGGPEDARSRILQYFIQRLGPEKHYFLCTAKEAELIKYMENSFFGVKVAFCHQFYDLCKVLGVNYNIVREGWLLDNRVGRMHTSIFDTKGFSGKCIPKDLKSISTFARRMNSPLTLIETALKYNKGILNADVKEVPSNSTSVDIVNISNPS